MSDPEQMTDRSRRINYLMRVARNKRELPGLISSLAKATGLPTDVLRFLTVEESDRIDRDYMLHYENKREHSKELHVTWTTADPVHQTLVTLANYVPSQLIYVMFHHSEYMGIMEMDSRTFLRHGVQIMLTSGDTVQCFTKDCATGLLIDFYEEGPTGVTFECVPWGTYRPPFEACIDQLGKSGLRRIWTGRTYLKSGTEPN